MKNGRRVSFLVVVVSTFLLVGVVSIVEGIRCYKCEDCLRESPTVVDCMDMDTLGSDSDFKHVCLKEASGTGFSRRCYAVLKEKAKNRCSEPKPKSSAVIYCECDEDKCNSGPASSLSMVLIITTSTAVAVSSSLIM